MEPYNSMPTVEVAHPGAPTTPDKARDRSVAPLTPEDLARYRSRGRLKALLAMLGALALLAFNHYTAIHDHRIWPKAIFVGAMIFACGFAALFQPLIMFRHLPVGKQFPRSVTLLMLLAMAIGAAGGWQIYTFYRG